MVESSQLQTKTARQCRFGSCITRATFSFSATPKEVYCKIHKHPDMTSNQTNKCSAVNCTVQGTFKDSSNNKWCV